MPPVADATVTLVTLRTTEPEFVRVTVRSAYAAVATMPKSIGSGEAVTSIVCPIAMVEMAARATSACPKGDEIWVASKNWMRPRLEPKGPVIDPKAMKVPLITALAPPPSWASKAVARTDPESRIMKTKDGFIQGYNAQAAVDATAQVIVAHGLDAKQSDQHQLAPMADAIEANLGKKPTQLSADAGYCCDANLTAMEEREIDAYIAPGRAKHAGEGEGGGARVAAMRERIKAGGHSSPYRLRKQLPEPVFGQIKQARGFRQFLLRGVEKVANEWGLVCLAHNILKLAQGRTTG